MSSEKSATGAQQNRVQCPECNDGVLRVINAIYADCDNCDAEVERNEVGL